MSLKDFMQQLQEQDNDVIYSKPPEESIQIIPPSKVDKAKNLDAIKIIPPKEEAPKVIKFKLNLNPAPVEPQPQPVQNTQPVQQEVPSRPTRKTPEVIIPPTKKSNNTQQSQQRPQPRVDQNAYSQVERPQKPQVEQKPIQQTREESPPINTPRDIGEELFIRSETPLSKKEKWFEYYNKALNSKKTNFVTDKCKRGRFMISEEDKFIVLSDYDTYDKDANEILRDSWF